MHRLADEIQHTHRDWVASDCVASLSHTLPESGDHDLTEVYGVELTFHCS
jgi:hypothetical protein